MHDYSSVRVCTCMPIWQSIKFQLLPVIVVYCGGYIATKALMTLFVEWE